MGSMKDLHIETMGLTHEWLELIAEILSQPNVGQAHVLQPDEEPDDEDLWEELRFIPDLSFTPAGEDAPWAIEFKMFRWQTDWRRRIVDAIAHMRHIVQQGRFARGIVLVSFDLTEEALEELQAQAEPSIEIWSLNRLQTLASASAELDEKLDVLAIDTVMEWSSAPARVGPLAQSPKAAGREVPEDLFSTTPISNRAPATTQAGVADLQLPPGAVIAARLRATPAGPAGWQAYEAGCADAVKFLFGKELHRPTQQQRSGGGHHRMDLICRIRSVGSSFWSMIESDFSTRYVVFEAKNSANPIGQDEIELTAKYLFDKGLRTVAIIFAREGSTDNARVAAEQTLRDRGTLVLAISMAELCAMLEGADAGDPPENIMFEKLDDFLMSMGR